jgi:radical SAM-linked protein
MEKIIYRAFYRKEGIASFMSHLDVMRTFTRAFKRAKIPVWYSQGFTKRPHLEFPLPLPLGVSGANEIMDFAITEAISDNNEFIQSVNCVLPNGLQIINVTEQLTDTNEIMFAKYNLYIPKNVNNDIINRFISQDTIYGEKYSKSKGMQTVEIKPYIQIVDFLDESSDIDKNIVTVILPTGNTFNLNVNVLINALAKYCNIKPEIIYAKRTEYLLNIPD